MKLPEREYPRFSDGEYARRHRALELVMQRHDVDHLLIVTDHRAGNAPHWVTGWPGTVEAYVIFKPGERMTMHVEWFNHLPLAKRLAQGVDVRWGEHRGMQKTIEELKRRGARRLGLIGPLAPSKYNVLASEFAVVLLDAEYVRLRLVKSEEEIQWMRVGAAMSDAGFTELLENTRPGLTERELANLVERAYVGQGGTTFIHYIGVTSMAAPHICVPPQFASLRKVASGDVVFCELSASWWDHAGQVLRTFTVDADPTPLYRDLHATAEAAFDAITVKIHHGTTMEEIVEVSAVIEERGFTIYDDLMHGFGGGYLPPILGSRSRPAGPLPAMTLEENMTVVVQPNVVTRDHKAGVQVGELIRVTRSGFERLHAAPRGLFRAG
ncbi:MAG TPA: M24 family metallopeptidase [Burkholderiales bacterium]|nr:M24 family metallopeptidase [Burkholderiales bacterium]